MNFRKRPIQERVFVIFLIYAVTSLVVAFVSFSLFRQLEKIDSTTDNMYQLHQYTMESLITGQQFFNYEANSVEYYSTEQSEYLEQHDVSLKRINLSLDSMLQNLEETGSIFFSDLSELKGKLMRYEVIFDEIRISINTRGIEDYGAIGQLRNIIHEAEYAFPEIKSEILTIRRHEKDYFIRHQGKYIQKLLAFINELPENETVKNMHLSRQVRLNNLLKQYTDEFNKIVSLNTMIGLHGHSGSTKQLNDTVDQINRLTKKILSSAIAKKKSNQKSIQIIVVIMVTVSVILTVLLMLSFRFFFRKRNKMPQ